MGGREAVPNTQFSRIPYGDPEVVVFRISGPLGPRARPHLERWTKERLRREMPCVVLDLSRIESLGGSTARLLNEFAAARAQRGYKTVFYVSSPTVLGLLSANASLRPPIIRQTLAEAVAQVKGATPTVIEEVAATPGGGHAISSNAGDALEDPDDLFGGPPSIAQETIDRPGARDQEQAESEPWEDAKGFGSMQARMVQMLQEGGLASRVHIFELHADDEYYLVTKNGIDFDRHLNRAAELVRRLREKSGPSFIFDLSGESLSEDEETLLSELKCEVVAPVRCEDGTELLIFVSKEQPGDEYSLEELEEIEVTLVAASRIVDRQATRSATTRVPPRGAPPARRDPGHPVREETPHVLSPVPERVPVHMASPVDAEGSDPPGVAGPVESQTERAQRRRVAQMRDILRLNRDFDSAFGTSRILEVLVLSIVSIARVETVLYFARRGNEYRLAHHRGIYPEALRELRLREDSTLLRAALSADRAVRIENSSQVVGEEKIWARQQGLQYVVPFSYKNNNLGIILFGGSDRNTDPDLEILQYLLHQAAFAYDRASLFETLQDRTLGVIRGLITLIEGRNAYDCGSTEQVVRYTYALAREIQYPSDSMRELVYGAVLRDVGLLRVNESLLRSAQDLTADEWDAIRRHTVEGAAIMRQMRFSNVSIDVVMHHHESYNGEGYPMGLRGRAIPLGARIVAVAESYVKMTMDRPYRKALGRAEALESMAENWGLRYDPLIVDALVRVVNREMSMGLQGDTKLTRDLFGE